MAVLRIVVFAFVLALIAACAATPTKLTAAMECEPPKSFFVVSHGWHTGLVLDRGDLLERVPELKDPFGNVPFLEVGWGDQKFYQSESVRIGLALRAILFPTASVLHIVEVPISPQRYFSGSEVREVSVPQGGYRKLVEFVAGTFSRIPGGDVVRLGRGIYGRSQFYGSKGEFHAFNTCNTWVAKAIAATGYPVSTRTVTAGGLMSQLDPSGNVETKCYSIR